MRTLRLHPEPSPRPYTPRYATLPPRPYPPLVEGVRSRLAPAERRHGPLDFPPPLLYLLYPSPCTFTMHTQNKTNMQTFLPASSFQQCARSLDSRRLNKQRVECMQIYNAARGIRLDADENVIGPAIGWRNHPATKMWRGYEHVLCMYALHICMECDARGILDNRKLGEFFMKRLKRHEYIVPFWWADPILKDKLTFSHRCNLVRKDAEFYLPKFPDVPENYDDIEYFWPVK